MLASHSHLPYSQAALENLATALNVTSANLWVSPQSGRLEVIADSCNRDEVSEDLAESEEL